MNRSNAAWFLGPALALPPEGLDAEDYWAFASGFPGSAMRGGTLVRRIVGRSGIEHRRSVLADGTGDLPFFSEPLRRGDPPPGTDARMSVYSREAPRIATAACASLLRAHAIQPGDVTHLITVSCTGFMAPGLDWHVAGALGLRPEVARLHVGFMGCHAALNAIGIGRAICAGERDALVLVATVELCTLHFQAGGSRDDLVPNALFADGASAFLLAGAARPEVSRAAYRVAGTWSRLVKDTADMMTWRITDQGFRMTLDSAVPGAIARELPAVAREWGWERAGAPCAWAIHPGGPRVLEGAAGALGLPAGAIDPSRRVLRRCGNMSSATLAFILDEVMRESPERIGMLAFGPGLAIEGGELLRADRTESRQR